MSLGLFPLCECSLNSQVLTKQKVKGHPSKIFIKLQELERKPKEAEQANSLFLNCLLTQFTGALFLILINLDLENFLFKYSLAGSFQGLFSSFLKECALLFYLIRGWT